MAAAPTRNLLILQTPDNQAMSDFETIRDYINADAPDIDVRIAINGRPNSVTRRWQKTRPSLVFSPVFLLNYDAQGGKIYAGRQMGKFAELEMLAAAGIPVPRWTEFRPGMHIDPAEFGEFVVTKPARGMRGQEVRLVRATDVPARFADMHQRTPNRMIVQRYVDNRDEEGRQVEYRVTTIFGEPVIALARRATHPRRPLAELATDPKGLITISRATGQERKLIDRADLLDFARQVAAKLPDIPVLGLDIIPSADGGFWILETNPIGTVWHFSSKFSIEHNPAEEREALYRQFDVLRRTAELLIAKTRAEAI